MNGVTGRLEKFQNGVDETWEWGRIRGRTPLSIMGRSGTLKWPALMLQRKCNGVRVFYNTFLENQGNFLKTLNIFENSTYFFIFLFFIYLFFFAFFMYERKKESGMFWFVISFLFSRIIALIILFVIVFYFKLLINKSKYELYILLNF